MKKLARTILFVLLLAVLSACGNGKPAKEPVHSSPAQREEKPAVAPITEPAVEVKSTEVGSVIS